MKDERNWLPGTSQTLRGVTGQTRPTFLERGIPSKVDDALRRFYPEQHKKFFREFLERKKSQSGHSRD
jgi:hypothetical protein